MGIKKLKVSAVIPAYNEEKNIGRVLNELEKCKLIDEIIVVDDGSKDETCKEAKKYRKVKIIKNKINLGKGKSMDIGVKKTKNEVIFFCDADLINFKAKMAEKIICPVIKNRKIMSIGARDRLGNKLLLALGKIGKRLFISGERALDKSIWFETSNFFKRGYKIEIGLNCFALKRGDIKVQLFPYKQIIQEKKGSVFNGLVKRFLFLNVDVLIALITSLFLIKNKFRYSE